MAHICGSHYISVGQHCSWQTGTWEGVYRETRHSTTDTALSALSLSSHKVMHSPQVQSCSCVVMPLSQGWQQIGPNVHKSFKINWLETWVLCYHSSRSAIQCVPTSDWVAQSMGWSTFRGWGNTEDLGHRSEGNRQPPTRTLARPGYYSAVSMMDWQEQLKRDSDSASQSRNEKYSRAQR